VSSQIATTIRQRAVRRSRTVTRRQRRVVAVQLLGPLTILAGVVWAIAQPYRIAFLYPDGKGFYDYVAQPPLLVVVVGLVFIFFVTPGLVEDLEKERRGPES
jgi:p-aminobenzoyl-glutamate transporter AbgT